MGIFIEDLYKDFKNIIDREIVQCVLFTDNVRLKNLLGWQRLAYW